MRALLFCLIFTINGFTHAQSSFKVVGYYSIKSAIENKDHYSFKYVTHLNLWFLNPDSAGVFHVDYNALKPFIDKAHKRNIKVLFSIGGGSKQPQYHHLLESESRGMLLTNLMEVLSMSNADGIDIDLEGSDIDQNYESFVTEMAKMLHSKNKLITAAVAVYYKEKMTDKVLNAYDFVNIMAYDRTGPWRPDRPGPHSTLSHAADDIRYFSLDRKMNKEKMTLGLPFYGYGFGQNNKVISMSYKKAVQTHGDIAYVDEYLLPENVIFYHNSIATIKEKTKLAKQATNGVMIWHVLNDVKGKKSLLKAIHEVKMSK